MEIEEVHSACRGMAWKCYDSSQRVDRAHRGTYILVYCGTRCLAVFRICGKVSLSLCVRSTSLESCADSDAPYATSQVCMQREPKDTDAI